MTYPIKQDLIPGLPRIPYRHGLGAYEGVVDHSTATPEATDENESVYFHREWKNREAFPHFVVDWDSITQLADTTYIAWAAGNGNPRYVHIEFCETRDPEKFKASYDRYVWLTAEILRRKGLGVSDGGTLVSHDWVSKNLGGTNHVDPIGYLASHGVSWGQHIANVQAMYNSFFSQPAPTPVPTTTVPDKFGMNPTVVMHVRCIAPTDIRKAPSHLANYVRDAQVGEVFDVYSIEDDWHCVGGTNWIDGNSGHNLYWLDNPALTQQSAPAPAPAPSGIPAVGNIRIVGVATAAIVMDRPDRNNCQNIGTLALGTVIPIAGSVSGSNNPRGYWEVIFQGKRAYVSGQFGQKI